MSLPEISSGNIFPSDANFSSPSAGGNHNAPAAVSGGGSERASRLKCTSEQGRCLAYLTIKHMVRTQGPHFHKGVSLGLNTWMAITRELNALGIEKTPEQWRKCYSAAKYFAHMRFFRLMKDKQALNPNARPDWNEIEIRDLLYLQDLRAKGYPDMPEPDVLMRAFDNKQMYLHDYHPPQKPPYAYPRDLFYDNNTSFSNNFNDFSQFSMPPQAEAHLNDTDEVQIKSEGIEASPIDVAEEFHQQLQQMVEAHSRMEYVQRPGANGTPPMSMSMPRPLPADALDPLASASASASAPASAKAATSSTPGVQRCRDSVESVESLAHGADGMHSVGGGGGGAGALPGPEHYYLERRLLEISEKLLKEKVKQNKILRKKNKLLRQTRKDQRRQTEVLNKLLEQLVRRSGSNM